MKGCGALRCGAKLGCALALAALLLSHPAQAERGHHAVTLGAERSVPYSSEGDPAGSNGDESKLTVRPLIVDSHVTEWTTGAAHEVTERSFVVRRALRLNDALPGEKTGRNGDWIWQRGPWLLIDRATGHVTQLKLPDYDPSVSDVVWFRDYGAYCGVTASGKSLYALVAKIAARKPMLRQKLQAFDATHHLSPVCAEAIWQRDPLRVTFQPTGGAARSFDLVGTSAVLVEQDEPERAATPGDAQPAEPQPASAKPASAKPASAKPASAKPADAKPTDANPAGPQR